MTSFSISGVNIEDRRNYVNKPNYMSLAGCSACGDATTSSNRRFFCSKKGEEKQLSFLFKLYTEIQVSHDDEFLCRNCHDKLLNIHEKAINFKILCKKTAELKKSPLSELHIEILAPSALLNQTPSPCPPLDAVSTSTSQCKNVDQSNSLVEHSYNSKKIERTHKKQKTIPRQLFPPTSEHDHTYYNGAVNDKDIFKVPNIVKSFFMNNTNNERYSFKKSEIKLLISLLSTGGNKQIIIKELLGIDQILEIILSELSNNLKGRVNGMNNRKKGFISILMEKELKDLETFSWENVVNEFSEQLPELFKLITSIIMPKDATSKIMCNLLPRIGMVYGIMMQGRHTGLSLLQRVNTLLLMDNIADQKIYDRLQTMGICLSYQNSLSLLENFGGTFNNTVIDALKTRKTIRLIGDNVNFKTGIYEQHYSTDGKLFDMHHAFSSAFLINKYTFLDTLDSTTPQRAWQHVSPVDLLMTKEERKHMRYAYVQIIAKVTAKFIPSLSFMAEVVPQNIKGEHTNLLTEKTKVIPLGTLPLNEQKYDDVVKILEDYENMLEQLHGQAEMNLTGDSFFHIGGDQLTRERFSGAKRLRARHDSIKDKFGHLYPITFEFFHLLMNFLKVFNHFLYNKNSNKEVGTMKSEIERIRRTNFNEDVNAAYDADKEFIVSFIDVHIVEMVLEYFGMDSIYSNPTKHVPPEFITDEEKKTWVYSTIGHLLDTYVFQANGCMAAPFSTDHVQEEVVEDATVMKCKLADGKIIELQLKRTKNGGKTEKTDGVMSYASMVLNLGFVLKELLDTCKTPDRNRMIRLMKQCMLIFKAKSNLSKYAVEVLRFLMQQTVLLSEKDATSTFYSMFVNTKGKLDSHIPADLQMEYLVKLTKTHIKHMFSNKSTQNISKKTKALSCIEAVCDNFDDNSHVKVRCKKHSHPTYHDDELMMLEDLRTLRPFKKSPGREHSCFKNIKLGIENYLEPAHFHEWIKKRICMDGTDIAI